MQIEIDNLNQELKRTKIDYEHRMKDSNNSETTLKDKINELNKRISEMIRESELKVRALNEEHQNAKMKMEAEHADAVATLQAQ